MSDRDDRLRAMENRMQTYYEKIMDQVYLQHHMHPTNLDHFNGMLDDMPLGEEYRGYANAAAQHGGGKKVILYTDASKSNGLPAKHR